MLDMGFEPQIRRIIEENNMPPAGSQEGCRQTMMFSATFPREMQDMAMDFLSPSYLWISVGNVGAAASSVEQRFEDCSHSTPDEKFEVLINSLKRVTNKDGGPAKTIVFANQKAIVSDVAWRLSDMRIRAREIHGGLSQNQRDRALADLKNGRAHVLVATDVAARGLDLPGIDHVINYDLASNVDDYVHRIGRTGRIGNTGIATTLVGNADPALKDVVKKIKQEANGNKEQKTELPSWLETMVSPRSRSPVRGAGKGYGRGGRSYGGYRDDSGGGSKGYGRGGSSSYDRDSSPYGRSSGSYGRSSSYDRSGGKGGSRGGSYGRDYGSYGRSSSYGGRSSSSGRGGGYTRSYDDDFDDDF
mmetsp:Transcript_116793/g.365102  ORF Transcript_116793/g.365102 Transcript_116793/m.365102 type:complete len:359 (+) Transcript_116793:3-1079(+)